jgi:arylsulfatase A-like enzyme
MIRLFLLTLLLLNAALHARPNILLILADDQGWGDLSSNGNQTLRTPHLDSLARDGAVLERFYVSPVCSPTRAEMMTGRYHLRTGVRNVTSGGERLNTDEQTLADVLRAAGYATGLFGKWHLGTQWPYHPNARGFDMFCGYTSGHWGTYWNAPLDLNGADITTEGYLTEGVTAP